MTFTETILSGVFVVESDVFTDDRGAFVRAWMPEEFAAHGLETHVAQCSMAQNRHRGTIRGMHYRAAPFAEAKVIRAVRGTVFDVAIDLRPESPTYRRWVGVELSAANRRVLYIPRGLAHGYQTLTDDAELVYFVSAPYAPDHERGVRWNDPAFGIVWPLGAPSVIHERDATYPDFDPASVTR
jgi:dTDP-4-dehydrorhamnose 3,5-epimerase